MDRNLKSDPAGLLGPQKTGNALLDTKVAEEIIPVGNQVYILAKTEIRGERIIIIMRDGSGDTF